MNIFKKYVLHFLNHVQNGVHFSYEMSYLFENCMYTGIFGGEYYWHFQQLLLLVFSAGNITGIVGDNYYWYRRRQLLMVFSGGDTIAYIYIYEYTK